jgi:hypothetical protein
MSFYASLALTAGRLVTKFGAPVTLRRTSGLSDPVHGFGDSLTEVSLQTTGITRTYPDELIDGERVLSTDRLIVLAPDVEPSISDKVVIGSRPWAVVSVKTASPAGTPLAYFAQVRR